MEAHCPRCSAAFTCNVGEQHCWCGQLSLTNEARTNIAKTYDGCLCSACLGELAIENADGPEVG